MDLCPHEDDPHSCPPCQRAAGRLKDPTPSRSFESRYEGRCQSCESRIDIGDMIQMLGGAPYHEECILT